MDQIAVQQWTAGIQKHTMPAGKEEFTTIRTPIRLPAVINVADLIGVLPLRVHFFSAGTLGTGHGAMTRPAPMSEACVQNSLRTQSWQSLPNHSLYQLQNGGNSRRVSRDFQHDSSRSRNASK